MPRGRPAGRDEIAADELEFYDRVTARAANPARREFSTAAEPERGVLELTIFIALLNMILTTQSALGMREPSDEEIDQIIRDLREGRRAVAEFVDRSG